MSLLEIGHIGCLLGGIAQAGHALDALNGVLVATELGVIFDCTSELRQG